MIAFTFISCDEPEAPHEHKWDEGKVTTEATCTEAGVKTYTCACGETKEEPIPAKGHTFSEAWEKDETNHWHKCTVEGCTGTSDKLAHTFSDWHLNADNTKLIIDCTACGQVKEEKEVTAVSTQAELGEAIVAKKPYVALLEDIEVQKQEGADFRFAFDYDFFIDLNGKTLKLNNYIELKKDAEDKPTTMTINNGTLAITRGTDPNSNAIVLNADTALEINKAIIESDVNGILTSEKANNMSVKLTNGSKLKVHGNFGISTNASVPFSKNVNLIIDNSEISVESTTKTKGDNTAILFNVDGQVVINNSKITADRQGIILRAGGTEEKPHMIKDSTITATGNNEVADEYLADNWSQGNEVPLAALVVGNRSAKDYELGTTVVLDNVELNTPVKNTAKKAYFDMYIYQNNETYPVSVILTGTKPGKVNAVETRHGAKYQEE